MKSSQAVRTQARRPRFLSHTTKPGKRFLVICIGGKSCRPPSGPSLHTYRCTQAVQTQARDLHFSHTRQSQAGDSWSFALEESRVGPSGAIPACFSFYVRRSGPTYFVDGSTQTVQSCRLSFGKPSLDVYHCAQALRTRASGRRNRLHERSLPCCSRGCPGK